MFSLCPSDRAVSQYLPMSSVFPGGFPWQRFSRLELVAGLSRSSLPCWPLSLSLHLEVPLDNQQHAASESLHLLIWEQLLDLYWAHLPCRWMCRHPHLDHLHPERCRCLPIIAWYIGRFVSRLLVARWRIWRIAPARRSPGRLSRVIVSGIETNIIEARSDGHPVASASSSGVACSSPPRRASLLI